MDRIAASERREPAAKADGPVRPAAPARPRDQVLAMQRSAGNRAVTALLARVARPPVAMLQRTVSDDMGELAKIRAREGGSTFGGILAEVLTMVPMVETWKSVPTSGYVVKLNDEEPENRKYLVAYQEAAKDDAVRYGNLVHELTHAAVDQAYDREFVDYVADVSHKKRATTADEWEAKGYAKENEYLLSYWAVPEYNEHLKNILVGLSSAADSSGLSAEQIQMIKNALMYGSRSPATEFDTVVNQSLTWMRMWGVDASDGFYQRVEAVAEDARARRAGEKDLAVAAPDLTVPATTAAPVGATKTKTKTKTKAKRRRKLCYLTTACTARRGLADDCTELTVLRRFRDEHLAALPGGGAMIEAYYSTAPAIMAAIGARPDADEIYDAVYDVVAACVAAIDAGRDDEALTAYAGMVVGLEAALCPASRVASDALARVAG